MNSPINTPANRDIIVCLVKNAKPIATNGE